MNETAINDTSAKAEWFESEQKKQEDELAFQYGSARKARRKLTKKAKIRIGSYSRR